MKNEQLVRAMRAAGRMGETRGGRGMWRRTADVAWSEPRPSCKGEGRGGLVGRVKNGQHKEQAPHT